MKRYYNFISEGKIAEIKDKYSDKIPEDVMSYFISISGMPKFKSSTLFEKMLKFYVDNKDNNKYKKLELHKFILDLVSLFQDKKEYLDVKDITKVKTLDELKNLLSAKYDKKMSYTMGLYYDGEEYIIFSPLDYETAYEYGDHAWCINREPKYFYNDSYKASYGGVVQCINKINSNKNYAIQINNLNDFFAYEEPEYDMEITVWNANDDTDFSGDLIDFEEKIKTWDISGYQEILDVLHKIQKDGIDPDDHMGDRYENLFDEFGPSYEQALEWAKEKLKVNDLFLFIINNCDSKILQQISSIFIGDKLNKTMIVDVLSANLPAQQYLTKYKLNYTGQKMPRMIWEFIYDNISEDEIIKIIEDNELFDDYASRVIKRNNDDDQFKITFEKVSDDRESLEYIVSRLSEEDSLKYLEYLGKEIDFDQLNGVSYEDFVILDLTKIEDWRTFREMSRWN